MSKLGLKIILPSAVDDASGLKKLEHYTGIEFTRGASDGGGVNGYHKLIGDDQLLKEMRFHNLFKVSAVKDAKVVKELNQTNWNQYSDGSDAVLDGSDGADILLANTSGIYAILGGTNPTYERFIISDSFFTYDGDESIYIPPRAYPVDVSVLYNNTFRSVRNDNITGEFSVKTGYFSDIQGDCSSYVNPTNKGAWTRYPANAVRKYVKAKNSEEGDVKYIPLDNVAMEIMQAMLYIEFRTKNLNSVLGYGCSSTITPYGVFWGKHTGARLIDSDGNITYINMSRTPLYINGTTQSSCYEMFGGSSHFKVMEPQLSVSNATEGTFESVYNSDGEAVQGISDGVMTGIYTKKFSCKINASLSNGGTVKEYTLEVVLRQPVVRGVCIPIGSKDTWVFGYEAVSCKVDADSDTIVSFYRCKDYTKLYLNNNDFCIKNTTENFDIETSSGYEKLGERKLSKTTEQKWHKDFYKSEDHNISTVVGAGTDGVNYAYDNIYQIMVLSTSFNTGYKWMAPMITGENTYDTLSPLHFHTFNFNMDSTRTATVAFCCILDND
jgi:hypothetical protein